MSDPQAAISQMGGRGRHQGRDGAMVPAATPDSYYGRPVLTAPVWTWEIAAYFFTGGLAGASATLAAGAGLTGNATLARRAWPVALAGAAVSPVLLISDLGRPERFLRMLRVFKPTSPMSVGTWVLSAFATATGLATGWQLLGVPPAAVGVPAAAVAALTGPVVSTYTAVLIAQTAVPAWHDARRELPFVFAGSSLASAGGAVAALTPVEAAAPARAMAVAGAAVEVAAATVMTRRLDPRVRAAYEAPSTGPFHQAARACTLGGAALLAAAGRRSRTATVAGGLALCAGSALERWAVYKAGRVSADDPAQTVGPQRDRRGRPRSSESSRAPSPSPHSAARSTTSPRRSS